MKETYLHYLWRQKRLPFHSLRLKDGRPFRIISTGIYNSNGAGPDFLHARIEIDGIVWVGHVEIHLRSSDWYKHNHQFDPAYDNVILHVVLEDDRPVVQKDLLLPVLEVNDVIEPQHYRQYLRFLEKMNSSIPCESYLKDIDPIFTRQMMDRCIVERMERRFLDIVSFGFPHRPKETFYRLLARAFGSKQNAEAFEMLSERIPFHSLRNRSVKDRKAMLLSVSGLQDGKSNEAFDKLEFAELMNLTGMGGMNRVAWNFGGVRPSAHPPIRVQQFAVLIGAIDLDLFLNEIAVTELITYFDQLIFDLNRTEQKRALHISKGLRDQLLINAVSPFLFWWGKINSNSILQENAIELLVKLPPEDNRTIRNWKERSINVNSAYESQALIELLNHYCFRKKCLSCSVGNKVLNR